MQRRRGSSKLDFQENRIVPGSKNREAEKDILQSARAEEIGKQNQLIEMRQQETGSRRCY